MVRRAPIRALGPLALVLAVLVPSCSRESGNELTVVASFYALAFAGQEVGGDGVEVIDLTPPGSEAHDVELSFEDRTSLESADLVLYLGDIGFQPQVERAVPDAKGEVVVAAGTIEGDDPHVWLDPVTFADTVGRVADGFARVDSANADDYRTRADDLRARLEALDERFRTTLADCQSRTMLVTHDAFGYLADRYGLEQVGLAGISPEGEPTADSLVQAEALVQEGKVNAVFYEETAEGRRIAEALGQDLDIPALPLATLESRPPKGNYLTVMDTNLESLVEGLGCQ
ncbi:MAG TPA: metal ABC transporter substrate-binding protein [Actinomycetota bacterium]|nr:metal ABC transporter substrate-binding protein [Actinomycetota bacterium]